MAQCAASTAGSRREILGEDGVVLPEVIAEGAQVGLKALENALARQSEACDDFDGRVDVELTLMDSEERLVQPAQDAWAEESCGAITVASGFEPLRKGQF